MLEKIAVLGAGNGGHAAAADLSLRGFEVNLYELPALRENIQPALKHGGIEAIGAKEGFAKLNMITVDIKEAIQGVDLVMVVVPAFVHKLFAEICVPWLESGQIVVLNPGSTGGALEFSKTLRDKGVDKDIRVAETHTLTYGCRLVGPAKVDIHLLVKKVLFAAFPGKYTKEVIKLFKKIYPSMISAKNVMETSLANGNPVIHSAATLLNAGRIEYSKGEFYLYKEGITASVAKVIKAVDKERMALCRAMGFTPIPEPRMCTLQGYAETAETYYKCYTTSRILTSVKGPPNLQHRYFTEDVAYGLVMWSSLGDMLGVPTPTIKSIIRLASVAIGVDYWKEGKRTVASLGLLGMNVEELNRFLAEGVRSD